MVNKKVLIGMSGGVDSSVAAYLMLQNGFSCIGTTMSLCDGLPDVSAMDSRDAATVAKRLGIPFYTMDACDAFRKEVVDPFVQAYENGLTPNPCILCNRHLKFRTMLHKALELGCDGVATGHYAIIKKDESTGRYLLYKAADKQKDQSYFLACLDQEQLSRTHLPLGSFTKDEIREIAEKQGFITARKKDSQDICFIPDGDYVSFIWTWRVKSSVSTKVLFPTPSVSAEVWALLWVNRCMSAARICRQTPLPSVLMRRCSTPPFWLRAGTGSPSRS